MSSGATPGPVIGLPDGFDFVQLLGTGGGGWVALAHQVDLDRLVAIKRLFGAGRDSQALGTVRTEGRALAAVHHPAVVQVYDLVVIGEDAALVMEYVAGGDLRTLLDTTAPSAAARVGILLDVASGLAHAHAVGVVHCDVKPANVLVGEDGRGKLADFGIARLGSTHGRLTQGTPRYMAPEQRTADAPLTAEVDAYAFALLVQETLWGTEATATRPTGRRVRRLTRLLDAALAPDPGDRPSVEQLGSCLAQIPGATWDEFPAHVENPRQSPALAQTVGADHAVTTTPGRGRSQTARVPKTQPAILSAAWSRRPTPPAPFYHRPRTRRHRALSWAFGAVAGIVVALLVVVAVRR